MGRQDAPGLPGLVSGLTQGTMALQGYSWPLAVLSPTGVCQIEADGTGRFVKACGFNLGPATSRAVVREPWTTPQLCLCQGPLTTLSSLPQTTVVVEAGAAGTATAQAGRPTTQGHTGATAAVLGAAPHTKANKVGLDQQMVQCGGGGGRSGDEGHRLAWAGG